MSDPSERVARLFEFYVQNVWPVHRKLVKRRLSRRCRSCAASEKMLALDSAGVCVSCRSFVEAAPAQRRSERDAEALSQSLGRYQGAGTGLYDALVLFSGGKDSTYMIHRLRTEFPRLRMLAFTIHNGFMSPVAERNVQELIERLDIDHVFVRPRKAFHVKLFRYCITHLNADGGYGTVDFSDGEFMLDTARRLAAEKDIPLILCGYSRYQVQNGLRLDDFESPRERECSDRVETAGLPLKDIFAPDEVELWWHGARWPRGRVARLFFPLFAWDLEEEEVKKKVAEWGLLPKKAHSPIATNHKLIPLLGVTDVHQRGYSGFEIEFCRMIREGKADYRQWLFTFEFLEYTARTGLFVKSVVIDLLAQLGLRTEDVGIRFNE